MTDVGSQRTGGQGNAATDVDFVALKPGQRIGRYEIVAVLGQGGFGITYRARDQQLGRDVAIKEYLPSALAIRQDGVTVLPRSTKVAEDFTWGRDRFVAEGRTLASLEHAPAIIQVFDFLEANGTAYIVMKLVPGDTLENRIRKGPLSAAEVDRILWPLLDGLEKVHDAGFLHRDIKPANILLDAEGQPTLIDFGASRAAMAGRSAVMTAIFTPGYAAAEQMTAAKQGPWTDIYALSATLYHAITGAVPPSSFDRMLEDEYKPLSQLAPPDFAPGLLVGLDAGLAVKATDRPQTIAGWRSILGQGGALATHATVALQKGPATVVPPIAVTPPPAAAAPAAKGGGKGLWIAVAAALLLVLGGGGFYAVTLQSEAELAKLRQEKAERDKADAEAALRRQVEEETRQKLAAEEAARRRQADEARAAQRRAQEDARRAADQAETELRHTILNRQHIQVSLASQGFDPGPIDGVFTPRTREALAAWQRSRNFPPTGFLDGPQYQALMRQGAMAIARFDESQRKLDDDRKAAEAKRKTEEDAQRRAAAAPPPVVPSAAPAVTPPAASGQPANPDGLWQGLYECPARAGGEPLRVTFSLNVRNGTGTWVPNVTRGTLSVTVSITGSKVQVTRLLALNTTASTPLFPPAQFTGPTRVFTLDGTVNGDIINAQGTETPPGRLCTAIINRR